jgi:uncharacterized membrane protein YphA (DoxX/SURF4 family)
MKRFTNPDLGLLILRLSLAAIFITHGWLKLADLSGTVAFFSTLGLPAVMAYLIAAIEFLGGLAMFLGIFPQIAGWLLALTMVGAIYLVKFPKGLVGGYELDLILLAASLAVALMGVGRYNVRAFRR